MPDLQTMLLIGLLAICALTDLSTHRIPNAAICVIALAGSVLPLCLNGPVETLMRAALALVMGAFLTAPWRAGMLGGGDLKLLSATALWFRPNQLPVFLAATAIAGGLLALMGYAAALARTPVVAEAVQSTAGRARSLLHNKVPYGVAIAAGGMFTALAGR